jgi:putative acetyltransferase
VTGVPVALSAILRRLEIADMDAAARIHRVAFEDRLSWLPRLHTPEEDRNYFRQRIFPTCSIWGAVEEGTVKGFIAFRQDWIDQFYVLPAAQGRGFGSALLEVAKRENSRLHLWTFQRNFPARRFYERRDFVLVRETDGSCNEEREPDALYAWPHQSKIAVMEASSSLL